MGASAVGVDVIFAESDRDSDGERLPRRGPGRTLESGGVVLGYAMRFDDAGGPSGSCVRHPLGLAVVTPPGHEARPLFRATGAVCSLPALHEAAGRSGFLNAAPDSDGILRRVPVLIEVDGQIYPSLALATVAGVAKTQNAVLEVVNTNASNLRLGERAIPLDGRGNLLVRYRGQKRTFPYLSAADVMQGRVPGGRRGEQDRVRGHDGARHARSGGHAARHALCGRRGAGDGGGQPAARRLRRGGPCTHPRSRRKS